MTTLYESFVPDGPLRHQTPTPAHFMEDAQEPALRGIVFRCTGVAALIASVGLWLVPVAPGDAAMQLARLGLSMTLLMGSGTLLASRDRGEAPTIEIDPRQRLLTIKHPATRGRPRHSDRYEIDALSEIVLRDGLLTARDAHGRSVLALSVTDAETHAALTRLLAQGRPRG